MTTPPPHQPALWVVSTIDPRRQYIWGIFTNKEQADRFADFVTAEIDPAESRPLRSPANELLSYHDYRTGQADH